MYHLIQLFSYYIFSQEKYNMSTEWLVQIFIAVVFKIAPNWRQPKCPSAIEWINKMWYIHIMECFSVIKRNKLLRDMHYLSMLSNKPPQTYWHNITHICYLTVSVSQKSGHSLARSSARLQSRCQPGLGSYLQAWLAMGPLPSSCKL